MGTKEFSMSAGTIVVLALVLLAVFFLIKAVVTVPQGANYTVARFGKYTKTLKPGLAIITPFIESIDNKVSMKERVLDVPSQEVITSDNDAALSSYEVNDLEYAILNLTMTNTRTVMGSMSLDELLSKRDDINKKLLVVVDEATRPWGVKVTRIEIKDINPPQDLVQAMGRQMKAERDKRASILEAEGERQSAILSAEGEKQAAVLQAEGRREAAFKDAEAREREAAAEAEATRLVSEAIATGDVQAINYFVADKYVTALKDVASAPNSKLILMPLEASSVIGALGGISEIARDAFGAKGGESDDGSSNRGSVPRTSQRG
jgi:regulator of protease activity HflC (stomatin/prohibitin superfamily)